MARRTSIAVASRMAMRAPARSNATRCTPTGAPSFRIAKVYSPASSPRAASGIASSAATAAQGKLLDIARQQSFHADCGQRLVAPGTQLAGVILQALRHAAFADLDLCAMRLEFAAAFGGDIGDRADRLL